VTQYEYTAKIFGTQDSFSQWYMFTNRMKIIFICEFLTFSPHVNNVKAL